MQLLEVIKMELMDVIAAWVALISLAISILLFLWINTTGISSTDTSIINGSSLCGAGMEEVNLTFCVSNHTKMIINGEVKKW